MHSPHHWPPSFSFRFLRPLNISCIAPLSLHHLLLNPFLSDPNSWLTPSPALAYPFGPLTSSSMYLTSYSTLPFVCHALPRLSIRHPILPPSPLLCVPYPSFPLTFPFILLTFQFRTPILFLHPYSFRSRTPTRNGSTVWGRLAEERQGGSRY
jgi:hypothetical protein